jgi:hypothetical protein
VLLPRLCALRTLSVTGSKTSACLDLLVRWLHIPPSVKIVTGDGTDRVSARVEVPTAALVANGWLQAIIGSQIPASFLLASSEDTRALMAHLPQYKCPLKVVLRYQMKPRELAQLASTSRSTSMSFRQLLPAHSWSGSELFKMTDEHLLALLEVVQPKGVEELALGRCKGLTDAGVLEFVQAGGAKLKKVSLINARSVTDKAMFALHRFCPELHELNLEDVPLVTVMGVAPLVASAPPPMRTFDLIDTGVNLEALTSMVAKLDVPGLDIVKGPKQHQITVMDRDWGVPLEDETESEPEMDEVDDSGDEA